MTVDEETPLLTDTRPNEQNGQQETARANEDETLKPQASIVAVIVPMMLGIFLIAMDQTIVASTYAAIGSEFEHLENTSWIATGYMLTLTSFQPLYGKVRFSGAHGCYLVLMSDS